MSDSQGLRAGRDVRRALPALAAAAIGVAAMIGAIVLDRHAGFLYSIPAIVFLLHLALVRAIYPSDGDADTEVIVAVIFLLALLSLISGVAWLLAALHLAWWIYAVLGAAFASAAVLWFSGALRKKYRGGPHYFQSWGIIRVPMQMTDPISAAEAEAREKTGTVYYIGYFDRSGKLLTVEKRRNGKTDYKYVYTYEKRKLVRYAYTDRDGKTRHFERTPAGWRAAGRDDG